MPNYKRVVEETRDPSTKEFNEYTIKVTDPKTDPPAERVFDRFKDFEAEMLCEILKELRIMNDNLILIIQKPIR